MSDALVSCSINDGIALVTMDDGKANALSTAMLDALDEAITKAETDAKALVIAGRPDKFSAGFDLKIMMSGPANARALVMKGGELLLRLYELPMPVVAACTGHAVAAGCLMLCACDTRIGTEGDFKIGLNEVAIGMTMPLLAQEFARDRLLPAHLTAAVIQAQLYSPSEAAAIGYLDRVVQGDTVSAALEQATALSKLNRKAYANTKRRVRQATLKYSRDTLESDLAELTGPS